METLTPTKEDYRYEKKYSINITDYDRAIQELKLHPACFSEIFYERRINNIYLDDLNLSSYFNHLDGYDKHMKARIRWYGDTFNDDIDAKLEFKMKNGKLGNKEIFPLESFSLDSQSSLKPLVKSILKKSSQEYLKLEYLMNYSPVLINSYMRRYFLSRCGNFRVTIDTDLSYFKLVSGRISDPIRDHNLAIIEINIQIIKRL